MERRTLIAALALVIAVAAVSAQDAVYLPGSGVSLPRAIKQVHPEYTEDAKAAKVKGTVVVEAVVLASGGVGDVRVVSTLDDGLDRQAVNATKLWVFEPGKKDGKPVAVLVQIAHTFNLK